MKELYSPEHSEQETEITIPELQKSLQTLHNLILNLTEDKPARQIVEDIKSGMPDQKFKKSNLQKMKDKLKLLVERGKNGNIFGRHAEQVYALIDVINDSFSLALEETVSEKVGAVKSKKIKAPRPEKTVTIIFGGNLILETANHQILTPEIVSRIVPEIKFHLTGGKLSQITHLQQKLLNLPELEQLIKKLHVISKTNTNEPELIRQSEEALVQINEFWEKDFLPLVVKFGSDQTHYSKIKQITKKLNVLTKNKVNQLKSSSQNALSEMEN